MNVVKAFTRGNYTITMKRVMNINEYQLHLFPAVHTFWFLEKNALLKNPASGTVLMIQLTQNSPTCAYRGKILRNWN